MVLSWLLLCLYAIAVCGRSDEFSLGCALTLAVAIEKITSGTIAQLLGAGLILVGILKIP
ncbi:MAG: hypothetical protein CM1200mP30_26810 [Pseudomonadota bacterium]|nr:MAG: hypothetical protein CM1200mP30_26810 [Pseudomonadota bacterium]